ncbi:hypothetical protein CLV71_103691 [Actinophytocola oryzae]|uniref:Uncharacterized protein n=1 Tax=Actinophytocola oryzae TaxID=502181 RepID=A0A4R7VZ29_9PSEU|nr:hypothetical protein CLV71_103691 [Actinophytocola oryzae]
MSCRFGGRRLRVEDRVAAAGKGGLLERLVRLLRVVRCPGTRCWFRPLREEWIRLRFGSGWRLWREDRVAVVCGVWAGLGWLRVLFAVGCWVVSCLCVGVWPRWLVRVWFECRVAVVCGVWAGFGWLGVLFAVGCWVVSCLCVGVWPRWLVRVWFECRVAVVCGFSVGFSRLEGLLAAVRRLGTRCWVAARQGAEVWFGLGRRLWREDRVAAACGFWAVLSRLAVLVGVVRCVGLGCRVVP